MDEAKRKERREANAALARYGYSAKERHKLLSSGKAQAVIAAEREKQRLARERAEAMRPKPKLTTGDPFIDAVLDLCFAQKK